MGDRRGDQIAWIIIVLIIIASAAICARKESEAYERGYSDGYEAGLADGYENGYSTGENKGYLTGYAARGRIESARQSSSPSTAEILSKYGLSESVQQPTTQTVYITDSGTKYHRDGCQYLRNSKMPISLSTAKERGYTPCSKCWN